MGTIGTDEGGARGPERRTLREAARLRPNSWSSMEVTVLDLSELGFRASCEARLPPGSGVSLDISGIGPVEAQIAWQRGGELGARFYQPINLQRCTWALEERRNALAQLLFQRAAAKRAGRDRAEQRLREEILGGLPMGSAGQ
jgi:hypothetical protein